MKNILQSKTIWGAIVSLVVAILAIFDIKVAADELQQVAEAVGLIVGFTLTVYGRLKAKKELTIKVPPAAPLLAFLLAAIIVFPGCATIRQNPEATKAVLKATLRIGLQAGLHAITKNNPDLQPYLAMLSNTIVFSAETNASPEAVEASIKNFVDTKIPDPFYRQLVLTSITDTLAIYKEFYLKNPEAKFDHDKKEILLAIAQAIDSVSKPTVRSEDTNALRLN